MSGALEDLRHLTWAGRLEWLENRLRALVVRPCPEEDRCVMGCTVGGWSRCPRRSLRGFPVVQEA